MASPNRACRETPRLQKPGVGQCHHQDWCRRLLVVAEGQILMGEPEVALDLEPRWVHQPVPGIWDRVIWPDLSDLRPEQRFRPSPADPLGDHRRRHRRRRREQPSHVGYESVEARPARRPLIRRLAVFRQRPIGGPSRNSSQSCCLSLRNPGREQVAYLRPIIQFDYLP